MSIEPWGRYTLQNAERRTIHAADDPVVVVRTPLGIVVAETWRNPHRGTVATFYETVVDGVVHYGREPGWRSHTGLAIMAHRWIKSLAARDQ